MSSATGAPESNLVGSEEQVREKGKKVGFRLGGREFLEDKEDVENAIPKRGSSKGSNGDEKVH